MSIFLSTSSKRIGATTQIDMATIHAALDADGSGGAGLAGTPAAGMNALATITSENKVHDERRLGDHAAANWLTVETVTQLGGY